MEAQFEASPLSNSELPKSVIETEIALLRFLCAGSGPIELRKRLTRQLAEYEWREPEHRVVYEGLNRIRKQDRDSLRQQLPSQATRMGFPDIDWDCYFTCPEESEGKLEEMAVGLISSSGKKP